MTKELSREQLLAATEEVVELLASIVKTEELLGIAKEREAQTSAMVPDSAAATQPDIGTERSLGDIDAEMRQQGFR